MYTRKTAPKVRDGKVQKKNRHAKTPNYWNTCQDEILVDIEKPGKGYKHFIKKRDIIRFLEMLPNREEIDTEFVAVILSRGRFSSDGWYRNGVVCICAWEKEMTRTMSKAHFNNHKEIFDRLGVEYQIKEDDATCFFKENQIKAYQLLHILLHEIGHHHDRIHTKSKKECSRGEDYAEDYALKYDKVIWNKYFDCFSR